MDKSLPHNCPRRSENPQADVMFPPPDEWRTDTWPEWPEQYGESPKTCSYCGCVKPSDAVKLIEAGWEVEMTTKTYKWYINQPGTSFYKRRFMAAMHNDNDLKDLGDKKLKEIVPCIKLYGQHLDVFDIQALNEAAKKARAVIDG